MGRFIKGEVVVILFPFTDLSGTKRRPAFVVTPLRGDDVILCQITSQNRNDGYSIPISKDDFVTGGIPIDSNIRPNLLFTADSNKIIESKGLVSQTKVKQVIGKIIEIIR
jgi:mRNA interferase MazF